MYLSFDGDVGMQGRGATPVPELDPFQVPIGIHPRPDTVQVLQAAM
jgi:hypothetical protein